MKFEILVFQYVASSEADHLYKKLKDFHLPPIEHKKDKPEQSYAPPSERSMWDYPHFTVWKAGEPEKILTDTKNYLVQVAKAFRVCEIGAAVISDSPRHYEIPYTLWFLFELDIDIDQEEPNSTSRRYENIRNATQQAKVAAKNITESSVFPYTPVYWFEGKKKQETPNPEIGHVAIKTGKGSAILRRVFGESSYHIINCDSDAACPSVPALGLLSSVAHLVERHYRRSVHIDILESLKHLYSLSEVATGSSRSPGTIEDITQKLHDARLQLARLNGLVHRVTQQYGGGEDGVTLYDVVAKDAYSALHNERSVSIENASLLAGAMKEVSALKYQKEANRIATIAQYIQATLIFGIVFQAAETAIEPSSLSGHLLIIGISVAAGVAMASWLRWHLR